MGARSWTERLEEVIDPALADRCLRVDEEFFLIKILRSIVDVLDSDGNMIVLLTIVFAPTSPSSPSTRARGSCKRFRGTSLLMTVSSFRSRKPSVMVVPSNVIGERALSIALSFRVVGLELVATELFLVNIVQPAVDRDEVEPERANKSFRAV